MSRTTRFSDITRLSGIPRWDFARLPRDGSSSGEVSPGKNMLSIWLLLKRHCPPILAPFTWPVFSIRRIVRSFTRR